MAANVSFIYSSSPLKRLRARFELKSALKYFTWILMENNNCFNSYYRHMHKTKTRENVWARAGISLPTTFRTQFVVLLFERKSNK